MVFRGTDTMAILTEWILAELALHPDIQERLHAELAAAEEGEEEEEEGGRAYLRAVVKEALRMHPPGPLLSWARLAVHDTEVGGYNVPAGTTAMVNMWAITHDPEWWEEPERFDPGRFFPASASAAASGGVGSGSLGAEEAEMRLAPFGAGARACPGKAMALASVELWVARIVRRFRLLPAPGRPVELAERLNLSCEMAAPLALQLKDRHVAPRGN
jgi:cytochrome P450